MGYIILGIYAVVMVVLLWTCNKRLNIISNIISQEPRPGEPGYTDRKEVK